MHIDESSLSHLRPTIFVCCLLFLYLHSGLYIHITHITYPRYASRSTTYMYTPHRRSARSFREAAIDLFRHNYISTGRDANYSIRVVRGPRRVVPRGAHSETGPRRGLRWGDRSVGQFTAVRLYAKYNFQLCATLCFVEFSRRYVSEQERLEPQQLGHRRRHLWVLITKPLVLQPSHLLRLRVRRCRKLLGQ